MRSFGAAHAAILSIAIAITPISQADPGQPNGNCPGAFSQLAESTAEDWRAPENIFGKSLPYLMPSALGVLTLTQYLKYVLLGEPGDPVFSEAFPITLANDTLTTLTSHWIATSKLDGLKRFLEGRGKNGEIGFWRRAGANTALGTTLISLTWLGAGIEVGPEQLCGALGLCAVVYPTLQALKTALYKRLPLRRDVKELRGLERDFPEQAAQLRQIASEKAKELGIGKKEAEFLLLTALEAVVTNQPIESRLSDELIALSPDVLLPLRDELLAVNEDLSAEGADLQKVDRSAVKRLRSLVETQRRLRRELLNELLRLTGDVPPSSREAQHLHALLSFGDAVSPQFSLALHRALQRRLRGHRGRIAFASVVDMSIAIGFFGGVCLEATNYWAKTGEIPPVLRLLAG